MRAQAAFHKFCSNCGFRDGGVPGPRPEWAARLSQPRQATNVAAAAAPMGVFPAAPMPNAALMGAPAPAYG